MTVSMWRAVVFEARSLGICQREREKERQIYSIKLTHKRLKWCGDSFAKYSPSTIQPNKRRKHACSNRPVSDTVTLMKPAVTRYTLPKPRNTRGSLTARFWKWNFSRTPGLENRKQLNIAGVVIGRLLNKRHATKLIAYVSNLQFSYQRVDSDGVLFRSFTAAVVERGTWQ